MNRTTRLVAAGAAAVVCLTGCSAGAARAGAAATVGDGTVKLSSLTDEVQYGLDQPEADAATQDEAAFQSLVLTVLVERRVVEAAAAAAGAAVGAQDLASSRAALVEQVGTDDLATEARKSGFSATVLDDVIRLGAARTALGRTLAAGLQVSQSDLQKAYDAALDTYDTATLRVIDVQTQAEAVQLAQQGQGTSDAAFAALATQMNTDPSLKTSGGKLADPVPHSQLASLGAAVLAAKAGDTLATSVKSGGVDDYVVVRVVSRDTTSLAEATPNLRDSLLQEQVSALIEARLARVKVTINPRFGSWDVAGQQVRGRDGKSETSVLSGTPAPTAPAEQPAAP